MNAKEKGIIDLMNTQQIQKISRIDLSVVFDRISYEVKKEVIDDIEKILISLAYQKVKGKLIRVNINHLNVIKILKKGLKEVNENG